LSILWLRATRFHLRYLLGEEFLFLFLEEYSWDASGVSLRIY